MRFCVYYLRARKNSDIWGLEQSLLHLYQVSQFDCTTRRHREREERERERKRERER